MSFDEANAIIKKHMDVGAYHQLGLLPLGEIVTGIEWRGNERGNEPFGWVHKDQLEELAG